MDTLIRIKKLIIKEQYYFTDKAQTEIERDNLTEYDILEAILNSPIITKTIRSKDRKPDGSPEYLYIIPGMTYLGITIYTKGKIVEKYGREYLYVIISSKRYIG